VAVGRADRQLRFDDASALLGERLAEGTIYHLLAWEGGRLFPDDYLAESAHGVCEGAPDGAGTGRVHGDAVAGA
jgi:hypothetical protein